jgi:hypothetical protein
MSRRPLRLRCAARDSAADLRPSSPTHRTQRIESRPNVSCSSPAAPAPVTSGGQAVALTATRPVSAGFVAESQCCVKLTSTAEMTPALLAIIWMIVKLSNDVLQTRPSPEISRPAASPPLKAALVATLYVPGCSFCPMGAATSICHVSESCALT